jgi:hypothetical protein
VKTDPLPGSLVTFTSPPIIRARREGKSEPRAAEALRCGGVGLAELLEQLSLLLRRHANAGVSDRELDPVPTICNHARPQPDLAFLGELAGIAQQMPIEIAAGRLILFADGLRMDVAQQLAEKLAAVGSSTYELLPFEEGRGFAALPIPSPLDIFLDLEGDRLAEDGAFDYLFGYAVRDAHRPHYMHVFHYAPYEVTAMKRLMGRYGTRADELDQLLRAGVFVDLYRVVRKALRAGVDSYSIKKLEPFYGLSREVDLHQVSRHRVRDL